MYRFPIAVAPVGVQKIFNPEGELASAAAAAAQGVPYIMSTAASSTKTARATNITASA